MAVFASLKAMGKHGGQVFKKNQTALVTAFLRRAILASSLPDFAQSSA
jgi:hypothetical protein